MSCALPNALHLTSQPHPTHYPPIAPSALDPLLVWTMKVETKKELKLKIIAPHYRLTAIFVCNNQHPISRKKQFWILFAGLENEQSTIKRVNKVAWKVPRVRNKQWKKDNAISDADVAAETIVSEEFHTKSHLNTAQFFNGRDGGQSSPLLQVAMTFNASATRQKGQKDW